MLKETLKSIVFVVSIVSAWIGMAILVAGMTGCIRLDSGKPMQVHVEHDVHIHLDRDKQRPGGVFRP